MSISNQHDVLVIGSGAAGLSLALRLANNGPVAIISKGPISEGCTYYAQGGISAVLGEDDSYQAHINDTINAGAGLCNPDSVRFTIEHGPENIQWLEQLGVPFTKETT
ncbi:MAG: FAD-dependent oxidoreductase, partial [Gammaproteobacteria bacterium]|nr:FAD-dependent oxidoreductase [Gammaproteobacteria bacterium]